jgi:histidinol-phosphate aminotransferase
MSFDLNKTARKSILSLTPYSSARDEFSGQAKVYLDANENPYNTKYNRYPDPMQLGLKSLISALRNLPPEHIFLGNGSDEIIDLVIRSFCDPAQDEIIVLPPTYGMYEVYAHINQVKVKEVPLDSEFDVNSKVVLQEVNEHTKIIFLCSPKNPSGNLLDTAQVKTILQKFNGLVVVDEAYIDFSDIESWSGYLDLYPNLLVMQTVSKAWGLAGIRLGMGFANSNIVELLTKVKPPYNISQLTQETAFEALQCVDQKEEVVQLIIQEREKLKKELSELDTVQLVYPSQANFLLVKINDAAQVYQELIKKGIVVRDRSQVLLCENCLRITIGTPDENKILLQGLKK